MYKNDLKAIAIAQAIQDAAYEGTIRAAVAHGKKKVYLTLIGGGVFGNKLDWIANALEKMKDFIIQSGLDVTLIIFDSTTKDLASQIDTFRQRMQQLVQATGGEYIQYTPSQPDGKRLVKKQEPAVEKKEIPEQKLEPEKIENLTKTLHMFTQTLHNVQRSLKSPGLKTRALLF